MTIPPSGENPKDAPDAAPDTRTVIANPAIKTHDAPQPAMPAGADVTIIAAHDGPPEPATGIVQPGVLINDNYRILELISAGGMGEVYRAENIFTGSPVAVKIILPNLARDATIIDMFRREAQMLVQLRHDTIVRYHNFVRDRGLDRYCLIMEFVEGKHLWDRIRQEGALDTDQAFILMRQLAGGLAQAHASGVTHRDLSPDNVILRDNRLDQAVVIDFGIARSTEFGDGLAGRFAGKFNYIAPEQMGHAGGEIGPAADIYGLALLIAAALRAEPLPMGDNIVAASEARREIPDLSGISHRIYPLLQYMLEPDPNHRPADMGALLTILDDPSHLPARYRLPLWSAEHAQSDQADSSDKNPICTSQTPVPYGSLSPFGTDPDVMAAPEGLAGRTARPAPSGRLLTRLLIGLAAGGLALAGAALFALRGVDVPPDPAPQVTAQPLPPLPPRDLSIRNGFLAQQPLPDCTFASRIASGPDAGKILGLADGPRDYSALQRTYKDEFGTEASMKPVQIASAQCPVVSFAHELLGRRETPPILTLDADHTQSGSMVSGRVANLRGRALWLFIVSAKGAVYDLSDSVQPLADGSVAFDFAITLNEGAARDSAPQIAVALTSGTPLTAVAAAPAGATASTLLPLVLTEIRQNGGDAALDLALLDLEPTPEPAP